MEGKEGPINHGDRVKREFSHFGRGGVGIAGWVQWLSDVLDVGRSWLLDETHSQKTTQLAGCEIALESKFHKKKQSQ